MHKNGFFHRDLKPENILLQNENVNYEFRLNYVILDWREKFVLDLLLQNMFQQDGIGLPN